MNTQNIASDSITAVLYRDNSLTKSYEGDFEILRDCNGREVCRLTGRLITRIRVKRLIRDALLFGRS